MQLENLFETLKYRKVVFYRQDGIIKRVTKPVEFDNELDQPKKPLFPISKERK